MAKVCLLAWCKYLMLLPWAAAAAAAGEESLLAAGLQLLVLSPDPNIAIVSVIMSHHVAINTVILIQRWHSCCHPY